jgi:lactate dehydrogenase-like 2-hydroxyacid dehydrogenase
VIAPIPPELRARLAEAYGLVEHRPAPGETRPGYRVAVTTSVAGIGAEAMAALPDLELILCNGTGTDRIDLAAAGARGIAVQNTPDVLTEDTADFAIGLIYATLRRIAEADRFIRAGRWDTERMTPSTRVYSRRLGIVGLGRIGSAVARRAAAIGMTVGYTGPREKPDLPYSYTPTLAQLAETSDILVLTCPASPETEGIVTADILDRLGPQGFLINIARGSVVDEPALIAALKARRIAGAGLDVFAREPALDPRLLDLDNVVLTPHVAAVTAETRAAMAALLRGAVDRLYAPQKDA